MNKKTTVRLSRSAENNMNTLTTALGIPQVAVMEIALAELSHNLPMWMTNRAPLIAWTLLNQMFRDATRKNISQVDTNKHRNLIEKFEFPEATLNSLMSTVLRDPKLSRQDGSLGEPPTTAKFHLTQEDMAVLNRYYTRGSILSEAVDAANAVRSLVQDKIRANFNAQKQFLLRDPQLNVTDISAPPEKAKPSPERIHAVKEFLKAKREIPGFFGKHYVNRLTPWDPAWHGSSCASLHLERGQSIHDNSVGPAT